MNQNKESIINSLYSQKKIGKKITKKINKQRTEHGTNIDKQTNKHDQPRSI